ncbi:MAG: M1 family aminopeptidase [Bacteroidota bacterium]
MDILKRVVLLLAITGTWISASSQQDTDNFNQNIYADINVPISMLSVTDTLYVPKAYFKTGKSLTFKLNKNLKLNVLSKGISLMKEVTALDEALTKTYTLLLNKEIVGEKVMVVLQYSGKIVDEIKKGAAEYARGFSETKGTITEKGVYLAGSTYWLPSFENNALWSFDLNVQIDTGWNVVSQGERTINKVENGKQLVKYHSPEPMDEVYLIAAKWTEYSLQADKVLVQAFLRTPDAKLANKYLGVTSQFINLYNKLIGPYPYTKFALVENFWETGYGMPSFTLLGSKVIRMPWILFSSYPHELLHNYWGNSVFVDYSEGNWCEGITVYMADHLIQEQRGTGSSYRRTTLQKFTDYVNEENDFPVSEFLSRNNSAEEAVGYGKSLMINNMLRWEFGDEKFIKAYSKFYNDNKFRKATFDDIRKSFEAVTGEDLNAFFTQWVDRKGAPTLKLSDVKLKKKRKQYRLSFVLKQVQKENVFNINIPIVVYLEGEDKVIEEKVTLNKREQVFSLIFDKKPLRIDIDPQFQIMRRLDRKEVPASLSQVFGEKEAIIILPGNSRHLNAYTALAKMWQKTQEAQGKKLAIVTDTKISSVPTDKAVWILGFENKFKGYVNIAEKYSTSLGSKKLEQINKMKKEGALIYAVPNPNNVYQSVGFIGANNDDAIAALSRKLLHYGKYSYLGFESEKATNTLKGLLPALDSPMNYIIDDKAEINAVIVPRKALSEAK